MRSFLFGLLGLVLSGGVAYGAPAVRTENPKVCSNVYSKLAEPTPTKVTRPPVVTEKKLVKKPSA